MYRPFIRLNTNICKICKRTFKSEKALKDHIFNKGVNDKYHISFKKQIRLMRFKDAKLRCPICEQKIFRAIGTHFRNSRDDYHKNFLRKQQDFLINSYLNLKSCSDIIKIKNKYTNNFSYKYVAALIIKKIGKLKFDEISKLIFSKKRKKYWGDLPKDKVNKIMKKIRDAEWSKLNKEQRKNHPWVLAGRKASLESSKRGTKNQRYAFELLKKKFSGFKWKYNYSLKDDWHVDIAAPEESVFIEWDGRHHFIPIYGQNYLANRKNRDKIKNKIITKEIKGCLLRVKDEGRANHKFVEEKINQISKILRRQIPKSKLIEL